MTRADRPGGPLTLAYCWAHVRRKFRDVSNSTKSAEAGRVLELIGRLYKVEKKLKGQPALVRQSIRTAQSRSIVDELFNILSC